MKSEWARVVCSNFISLRVLQFSECNTVQGDYFYERGNRRKSKKAFRNGKTLQKERIFASASFFFWRSDNRGSKWKKIVSSFDELKSRNRIQTGKLGMEMIQDGEPSCSS